MSSISHDKSAVIFRWASMGKPSALSISGVSDTRGVTSVQARPKALTRAAAAPG